MVLQKSQPGPSVERRHLVGVPLVSGKASPALPHFLWPEKRRGGGGVEVCGVTLASTSEWPL